MEKAIQDFMIANMIILTGSGDKSVGIYVDDIPDDRENTGVVLSTILRTPDEDVPELEYSTIQFLVYSPDKNSQKRLSANVDTLFKQLLKVNLNEEVEALYSDRLTGPSPWIGAFDSNSYAVMTFRFDFRERVNNV